MTTTVADVVADGLARAGTARAFVAAAGGRLAGLGEALGRRGLTVVRVDAPEAACAMAAVSGLLDHAPGAAAIGGAPAAAARGVASAFDERAPAVIITDRSVSALAAVAKASLAVAPASAAHWIAHACQLAMKEPRGPVHLAVPAAVAAAAALPVATSTRPAPPPAPDPAHLDAAARRLAASERPVVVIGRLCRTEADAAWVRPFAEARPAPVLVTPGARGVVPDPHPLLIGTLDAGDAERALIASADLIVAIGVDERETRGGAWPAPVLTITPVTAETPPPGAATVAGDIGLILEELAPRLRDRRLAEWDVARLHALKQAAAAPPGDSRGRAAHEIVAAARRLTPPGTIAVFERGGAGAEASRAWPAVAPGQCLFAPRGLAVAAAVAAQLSRPERRVVCFTTAEAMRDGVGGQLDTALGLGAPAVIVVSGGLAEIGARTSARTFDVPSPSRFADAFEAALGAPPPALLGVARE
jgi:acetolactate synthase-1/2/3 large subunit